jgi:hypothetical protein
VPKREASLCVWVATGGEGKDRTSVR